MPMSGNHAQDDARKVHQFEPEPPVQPDEPPARRARQFTPDDQTLLNGIPEPITANQTLPGLEDYAHLKLDRIPLKGLRALGLGLLALVLVVATAELIQLFDAALKTHWLVAALFSALIGTVAVLAGRALLSFFGARKSLDALNRLRARAERLTGRRSSGQSKELLQALQAFYTNKPQAALFSQTLESLPDYSDDSETLTHINQHFLRTLDQEAMQRISRCSAQTGLAIAISPWAALDMLLAVWRSLIMIDDIAQVYGVAPSLPTRLKLLPQVLQQLTFVGASELAIDQMSDDLGGAALASAFSARAGQGLGAGIMSARLGLATVRVLRPIPFAEGQQPGLRHLLRPLIEKLKTRLTGGHRTAGE